MVDALLRQNRCGQQPKWTQLGISLPKDPLHLKNVSALLLDELDRMALALKDPDLQARWFKVKKWITVPQPGLPRGRAVDAELTEEKKKWGPPKRVRSVMSAVVAPPRKLPSRAACVFFKFCLNGNDVHERER